MPPTRIDAAEACISRAEICQKEGNLAAAANFFLFAALEPLKNSDFERVKAYIYRAFAREANLSPIDRLNFSNALLSLSNYLARQTYAATRKGKAVEELRSN